LELFLRTYTRMHPHASFSILSTRRGGVRVVINYLGRESRERSHSCACEPHGLRNSHQAGRDEDTQHTHNSQKCKVQTQTWLSQSTDTRHDKLSITSKCGVRTDLGVSACFGFASKVCGVPLLDHHQISEHKATNMMIVPGLQIRHKSSLGIQTHIS
jgi:hypothetical protein